MLTAKQQAFVDGLLSGEFQQGAGALRIGNRFCCLGVMCEIYRRLTGLGEWVENVADDDPNRSDNSFRFVLPDTQAISYLPPNVWKYFTDGKPGRADVRPANAMPKELDPVLTINDRDNRASWWNDRQSAIDFPGIAAAFEQEFERINAEVTE